LGPDDLVVVVAPRIRGDDAAAGIIGQRGRQRKLKVVDGQNDNGFVRRIGLGEQGGVAALFDVAFEVAHFARAARSDPRVEKVGVCGLVDGQDAAVVKAKATGLLFDSSRFDRGRGGVCERHAAILSRMAWLIGPLA